MYRLLSALQYKLVNLSIDLLSFDLLSIDFLIVYFLIIYFLTLYPVAVYFLTLLCFLFLDPLLNDTLPHAVYFLTHSPPSSPGTVYFLTPRSRSITSWPFTSRPITSWSFGRLLFDPFLTVCLFDILLLNPLLLDLLDLELAL